MDAILSEYCRLESALDGRCVHEILPEAALTERKADSGVGTHHPDPVLVAEGNDLLQ